MRQGILPLVLALAVRGGQPVPAPRPPVQARLTDPQVEGLAKTAIASEDPKVQADTLALLEHYHFKSSLAPQRELALFVQGMLEDRAGFGIDACALGANLVAGELQHDAAEAFVRDDEVGAAADDHGSEAAFARDAQGFDEAFVIAGFGVNVGRTADAEAGIGGKRGVEPHVDVRHRSEARGH